MLYFCWFTVSCMRAIFHYCVVFFFFQAEDGIRDIGVTGVQTCALPIYDKENKMQQSKLFNRARKYLFVFAVVLLLFELNSFVYAQSNPKPLSICELLKDRKSVV